MELTCRRCGEKVSGPQEKSVMDTMKRHMAKKHPKKKSK